MELKEKIKKEIEEHKEALNVLVEQAQKLYQQLMQAQELIKQRRGAIGGLQKVLQNEPTPPEEENEAVDPSVN